MKPLTFLHDEHEYGPLVHITSWRGLFDLTQEDLFILSIEFSLHVRQVFTGLRYRYLYTSIQSGVINVFLLFCCYLVVQKTSR